LTKVDNADDAVLKWLVEEEMTVKPVSQKGFRTLYKVYSGADSAYFLSLSQADDDNKFVVGAGIVLDDQNQNRLRKSNETPRLIKELSLVLHSSPALFRIEQKDGIPNRIDIYKFVYQEELSKANIMNAIFTVDKVRALSLIKLGDYIPQEVPVSLSVEKPRGPTTQMTAQRSANQCPSCGSPAEEGAKFCGKCGRSLT